MSLEWTTGNRLTLLENGEGFYPRAFECIAGAEHEVLLETFILADDDVGQALQRALLQAASRGATVHVLMDGWGSADLPASFTQPLLDAGVRLRSFEPAQRLFGARLNVLRRMHRKLLVVDGRVAFVGGINYSVEHLVEAGPQGMRDYAVQVQGPLVGQIHAFCRAGVEQPQPRRRQWLARWRQARARRPQAADDASPDPADTGAGGLRAAFVTRDNLGHRNDIERAYRVALRSARERVLIVNAYFFPGYRLLRALRKAARRGVQVDLVLQGSPDQPWVQRASEMLYAYLLRAGVCVHLYRERPVHAKVAVVDDRWATVGSSNLDPTSLSLNLEANLVVRDAGFARDLRQRIEQQLLQHSERVQFPVPGRLASAWIALRNTLMFHAMRRFSAWATRSTDAAPQVVTLGTDARPPDPVR